MCEKLDKDVGDDSDKVEDVESFSLKSSLWINRRQLAT